MALHARDATTVVYKRHVGKYLDTDQGIRCNNCICIISGSVCAVLISSDALRNSESNEIFPAHLVPEQLTHLVLSIILGFHALTGCNTMLPLSVKDKTTF